MDAARTAATVEVGRAVAVATAKGLVQAIAW